MSLDRVWLLSRFRVQFGLHCAFLTIVAVEKSDVRALRSYRFALPPVRWVYGFDRDFVRA